MGTASDQKPVVDDSEAPEQEESKVRTQVSRSAKAGLVLPVSRYEAYVSHKVPRGRRGGSGTAVALTAATENIVRDILDGCVERMARHKRKRISIEDVVETVSSDRELAATFGDASAYFGDHIAHVGKKVAEAQSTKIKS